MEIIISTGKKDVMLRGADGNYELCEKKKVARDGELVETWGAYAWYSSISSALSRLAEVKISNSDARTIEELQMEVKRVHREIVDIYGIGL